MVHHKGNRTGRFYSSSLNIHASVLQAHSISFIQTIDLLLFCEKDPSTIVNGGNGCLLHFQCFCWKLGSFREKMYEIFSIYERLSVPNIVVENDRAIEDQILNFWHLKFAVSLLLLEVR